MQRDRHVCGRSVYARVFRLLVQGCTLFLGSYIDFPRFGLDNLINGLAFVIIVNGIVTVWNSLQRQAQAAGMIGHRNDAGADLHMVVPLLLAVGMEAKLKALPLVAVLVSALTAALGGPAPLLTLFGITIFSILLLAMLMKPSKQVKIVHSVCLLASVVITRLAIHTLSNRFEQTGGGFTLGKTANERPSRRLPG